MLWLFLLYTSVLIRVFKDALVRFADKDLLASIGKKRSVCFAVQQLRARTLCCEPRALSFAESLGLASFAAVKLRCRHSFAMQQRRTLSFAKSIDRMFCMLVRFADKSILVVGYVNNDLLTSLPACSATV